MTAADRRAPRPIFLVRLRPEPGIEPVQALRGGLKILLRRFGLKAINVVEERKPDCRGGVK